jgi:hypothetical protein
MDTLLGVFGVIIGILEVIVVVVDFFSFDFHVHRRPLRRGCNCTFLFRHLVSNRVEVRVGNEEGRDQDQDEFNTVSDRKPPLALDLDLSGTTLNPTFGQTLQSSPTLISLLRP